jgi:hypothetical protein
MYVWTFSYSHDKIIEGMIESKINKYFLDSSYIDRAIEEMIPLRYNLFLSYIRGFYSTTLTYLKLLLA